MISEGDRVIEKVSIVVDGEVPQNVFFLSHRSYCVENSPDIQERLSYQRKRTEFDLTIC